MEEKGNVFLGFVLLEEPKCDLDNIMKKLEEVWGIVPEGEIEKSEDNIVVFNCGHAIVSYMYVPSPVPNGEAEENAAYNFLWRNAIEEVQKHKAQIIVSVSGCEHMKMTETGTLFVKAVECCLYDENVIGVYTNGIVYEPSHYISFAQMIHDDMLPIYNLVWFGVSKQQNGLLRGYTMGLDKFGKTEIETLDCQASPMELIDFLSGIADFVITEDITLGDGETIGFSEEQKLRITLSPGVEFDYDTLKIEYPSTPHEDN